MNWKGEKNSLSESGLSGANRIKYLQLGHMKEKAVYYEDKLTMNGTFIVFDWNNIAPCVN